MGLAGTNTVGNRKLRGAKIGSPGPMRDEGMKKEGTKSAAADLYGVRNAKPRLEHE
jgi:hypothetical protein